MQSTDEIKREKKRLIIRTICILLILIGVALIFYLYYRVLIFNNVEAGKVYGDSTFNCGRYEVHTLKYYYRHKGVSYFDKMDYMMTEGLKVGDSLEVRVFNPYAEKHMIQTVIRDVSKRYNYHHEDHLKTCYHIHVEKLSDYEPANATSIETPKGNRLILSSTTPSEIKDGVVKTIDNIRFNYGSLIEYFVLRSNRDSILLHSVYYYLNDFSIDAMPSFIMQKQLTNLFPSKKICLSVLDKNNAKRERKLEVE